MKVLLAWEFGGNWGHLASLLPLASKLRAKGHEVVFAIRSMDGDLSPLISKGFDYLAMPLAMAPLQLYGRQPTHGYIDVLVRAGFSDAKTLPQLVAAWRGILSQVRPNLVVCKYAPLAEFATRDRPVMTIGTGFELPPLTDPLPSYGDTSIEINESLQKTEDTVLTVMKTVGVEYSEKWSCVGHAFSHTHRAFLTCPELDHFGARPDATYMGAAEELCPNSSAHTKVEKFLHEHNGRCVFAYLRLGAAWIQSFVEEFLIQQAQGSLIIVDPTLNLEECDQLSKPCVLVLQQPIDVTALGSQVDTFVCHASHGMVASALGRRKRLLMLPQYVEQIMLARRVLASQSSQSAVAMMLTPQLASEAVKVVARLGRMPPPLLNDAMSQDPVTELVELAEKLTTRRYAFSGISSPG